MKQKASFFLIIAIFLFWPLWMRAEDTFGQEVDFNIESSFDIGGKKETTAILVKTSRTAYWYLDAGIPETQEIKDALDILSQEFEANMYPTLTKIFGSEWTPGIDKDTRITILFHPMKEGRGGYFRSADEYPKIQIPASNEREMIYVNSQHLTGSNIKSFVAHELMHLITFNQKEKKYNISEDIWLNEGRAEYVSTLLGYDSEYKGSYLQKRVKDFLNKPFDSLTEWRDFPEDYGVANVFIQYLADHYGIQILSDSLRLPQAGIKSINTVLSGQGFKEDFSRAFINWTIAVLVNNCQISEKYCYFNANLKNLKVVPLLNFLPSAGPSTLSVVNTTKDWAGNWYKFIGGNSIFNIEFRVAGELAFKVPYVLEKKSGDFYIDFLDLDKTGSGYLQLDDFGSQNIALTIIPIVQNKTANFSGLEQTSSFFWLASTKQEEELTIPSISPLSKPISQMTKEEIVSRISEIMNVVVQLRELLAKLTGSQVFCQSITQNLYFGMENNQQVKCLQEFLKLQGSDIYPEGIINGNFYILTQRAVIRFQEKYASEILAPVNEVKGTGYVGLSTRVKINELLTK